MLTTTRKITGAIRVHSLVTALDGTADRAFELCHRARELLRGHVNELKDAKVSRVVWLVVWRSRIAGAWKY